MWRYNAPAGSATIQYDSLSGYFLAFNQGEYIGSFVTPQLAADALHHWPAEAGRAIPADLGQWKTESTQIWYE